MKKVLISIFVLICSLNNANATPISSSVDVALNGSTLINFESVTLGEYNSLVLNGVTINGIGSSLTVCNGCGGGGGAYGDVGTSLQNTGGSPASFDLIFDNSVSAFGIVGGALNNPWTYTAYDINNSVIETLNISGQCCSGQFHGIAANGIHRVNLNGNGDWAIFDNLQFVSQQNDVPEPGSVALLGLGLIGFVMAYRRKS